MKLYLVQHAQPKPKEQDPEKGLSDKGISDSERVAALIRPLGVHVRAVWQSGKKRAAQTAEILERALASDKGVIRRAGLAPLDSIDPSVASIAAATDDLMIVGHLPFLGKLASRLAAGSESADAVAFQQGGVVCLERDREGIWRIRWMVTPDILP